MNYLLHTAATNSNPYVRIAAYQLALGRSRGYVIRMLMDTFDLLLDEARNITKEIH
jgi:hypothetical protein